MREPMRALVVLMAVAACGGGGKDPAVCRREAAALGALLSTMDHELPAIYVGDATLVLRPGLAAQTFPRAPELFLTGHGISFQGQLVGAGALEERLAAERARGRDLDTTLAHVAAAEDARWSDVVATLRALHAQGYNQPAIWFARPASPVTRPPRSAVDDELDAIEHGDDASSKATRVVALMEQLVKGCQPMQETFGEVAMDGAESKAERIIRGIEPSLVACNCNVDMPSFAAAMFRLLHVDKPVTAFTITLDPAATPITEPPSAPWRTVHDRLTPGATVWVN